MTSPAESLRMLAAEPASEGLPLWLIGQVAARRRKAFMARVGLAPAAFRFLRLVERQEGITQAAIEHAMDADGAAVTRLSKQLQKAGLIRRAPAPEDNRFTCVYLTPKGRQRLAGITAAIDEMNSVGFADISPEDLAVCRRVLQQLLENLADL